MVTVRGTVDQPIPYPVLEDSPNTATSEIIGIQYLRGFCAIAVVASHVSQMAAFPKYYGATILGGALANGSLGVDMFFVISGFIITVISSGDGAISRTTFCYKRFCRIIPVMWVAILAFLLLRMAFTSTEIVPAAYIRAALLIPYGDVQPNTIWTLRHELIFYIVFAIGMLGRRPLRWIMWGWLAASVFIPVATNGLWAGVDEASPAGIIFSPINLEFFAGMVLGLHWSKRPAATQKIPLHPLFLLALLSLVILISIGLRPLVRSLPQVAALTIMAGIVVWLAAQLPFRTGRLSTVGRLLGSASYAIYLFHPPIVAGLGRMGSAIGRNHVELAIPVIVAVTVAGCVVMHLAVERPLVRLTQRLLSSSLRFEPGQGRLARHPAPSVAADSPARGPQWLAPETARTRR